MAQMAMAMTEPERVQVAVETEPVEMAAAEVVRATAGEVQSEGRTGSLAHHQA